MEDLAWVDDTEDLILARKDWFEEAQAFCMGLRDSLNIDETEWTERVPDVLRTLFGAADLLDSYDNIALSELRALLMLIQSTAQIGARLCEIQRQKKRGWLGNLKTALQTMLRSRVR